MSAAAASGFEVSEGQLASEELPKAKAEGKDVGLDRILSALQKKKKKVQSGASVI